ncbi:MAG TPA: helix-turn-helix transcriptional regulator [Nocardioidaceae bacterium]|nr:helix-turn-helix transcriptional regulator [Nocardioidaceae bacterium]
MSETQQRSTATDRERWFGENLRAAREQKEMSQTALAKKMAAAGFSNFHQSTVGRIEAGERPVRLSEGQELSLILGIPLGFLTWPPARLNRLNKFLYAVQNARERYVSLEELTQDFLNSVEMLAQFLPDIEKLLDNGELGEEDLPPNFDMDLQQARQLVSSTPEDAVLQGRARGPSEPKAPRVAPRTFDRAAEQPADAPPQDSDDELTGSLRALNERIHSAQATPEDVLRRQILELLLDSGDRTPNETALGLQELVDQLKIVKAARDFKAEREHHERDKLIRELRDLRNFEREYRQRLESWLLELGDAAAFRDYSEARDNIEEGLRELGSAHGVENSD